MGGEQHAQRDRKRDDPLAHRHSGNEVMALGQPLDQVGGGLGHSPGAAGGAKSTSLAGEGDPLLVRALGSRAQAIFAKSIAWKFQHDIFNGVRCE